LYTQGVDPGLDFSDIDEERQVIEECNQIPVHPRHPYVGDLVHTAFSGSHQDAIKKGFAQQQQDAIWEVPYLPIDPADIGRSYDAVIRVNSQSGKGGMSYLLEQEFGLSLPRRLQIEFSRAVQAETDQSGKEMSAQDIYAVFQREYLDAQTPYAYQAHHILEHINSPSEPAQVQLHLDMLQQGQPQAVHGAGNGPIDAFTHALRTAGVDVRVMDYHEHAIGAGDDASAVCYIEVRVDNGPTRFGVGIDGNIVTASFKAIFSAVNREACLAGQAMAA
jgi:2-isopropylmalate synthase